MIYLGLQRMPKQMKLKLKQKAKLIQRMRLSAVRNKTVPRGANNRHPTTELCQLP